MSNLVEKAVKPVNYSPELTAKLIELYAAGQGMSIKDIAVEIDRPEKSVRGKLVSLKVYVAADKPIKTLKDEGPTKKALIGELEALGFSPVALKGLESATKPALAEVIDYAKRTASAVA